MTNEKFTPGKWRITYYSRQFHPEEHYCIYSTLGGKKIAIIKFLDGSDGTTEEANAHLISSAPDMYALLSMMVSPTIMMSQIMRNDDLRTAIEAVLKKARGEA